MTLIAQAEFTQAEFTQAGLARARSVYRYLSFLMMGFSFWALFNQDLFP